MTGFNSKKNAAADKSWLMENLNCAIRQQDIERKNKALAQQAQEQEPVQEPLKLWLWKNFVDGKPEYWAFDNPFPCVSVGGDPLTLGEPCGWALFKLSVNGRPDRSEQEVINTVTRLAILPAQPAQEPVALVIDGVLVKSELPEKYTGHLYTTPPKREWVGLTDEEIAQGNKESWVDKQAWQSAVWWAEAKLKENNT